MLIIFDLDDTLIDTTRIITPFKHRAVFKELQLENWERFVEINRNSIGTLQAFKVFFTEMGLPQEFLERAKTILTAPLPEEFEVQRVPGALPLLERLQTFHTLALVTLGDPKLQLQKMNKAGILPQLFSKLIVGRGPSKKPEYQKILAEFEVSPEEAIVCGDRIAIDLTPAKELGLTTIHYPHGRGEGRTGNPEDVDFKITKLDGLENFIQRACL